MRPLPSILRAATGAALLAWAAPARAAPSLAPYYERTLMGEAGARCALFAPAVLESLRAGAAQARSAALGAGAARREVDATRDRALLKARGVSCASADLRIAAQRVRAAFLSWSHQPQLQLPGRGGGWTAQRPWLKGPRWTLSTHARLAGAPLTFGLARLAGPSAELAADAAWPGAARASAARLVMRDAARAPDPYLAADGQPPAQAARVVLAQARGPAPKEIGPGVLFGFPPAAAAAMAQLDPRENVRLELLFPSSGRDRVISTLIPVGDFATGPRLSGGGAVGHRPSQAEPGTSLPSNALAEGPRMHPAPALRPPADDESPRGQVACLAGVLNVRSRTLVIPTGTTVSLCAREGSAGRPAQSPPICDDDPPKQT